MEKTPALVPALLVLAACSAAPSPEPTAQLSQAADLKDGWVGTWAAAPHGDGTTFQNKTLRQIVRTSIGGSAVRIRISNAFGDQPLLVDDIHVAERSVGSAIVPGTDQVLRFGGQTSLSVPAGQFATSDAVTFAVKPLSDLAISFHLAGTNNAGTAHGTGLQDNYVADGSVSGNANLNGAQTRGSYYFLSNVDVQNAEAWGAVVTLGASITDGVASGGNQNRRWPNDLAKRLNDAKIPIGVLNQGISGNRLLADGSGQSALKRFDRDVLSQAGVRWVIFSDDPINDLGSGNPPSGQQLIDGLKQLVERAHAAKIEFWCSTLTPFEGSGGWKPAGETARSAIHTFIKSQDSGCDAIVDQDNATHDPAKPTWFLPKFDAGDHLHPNEAGLQAIADAVVLTGFTAPEGASGAGGSSGASAGGAAATAGSAGATATAGNASGGAAGAGGAPNVGSPSAGSAAISGSGGSSATAGTTATAAGTTSMTDGDDRVLPPSDGCSCRFGTASARPVSTHASILTPQYSLAVLALLGFAARRRRRPTSPNLASTSA